MVFSPILYLYCCTLFLETGIFGMLIKTHFVAVTFHTSSLLWFVLLTTQTEGSIFCGAVELSRGGLANPSQETFLKSYVVVYPRHPLL